MVRLFWVLAGLLVAWPACAQAQAWQVTRLKVAGAAVDVAPVKWRDRPDAALLDRQLRLKDTLLDGAELRAADNVEIDVLSPQGVKMSKSAGDAGRLLLVASGKGGDRVEVREGKWSFSRATAGLANQLDAFSAKAGSAAARTKGTVFTVAVDEAAGLARFQVQEGVIQVSMPLSSAAPLSGGREPTQIRELTASDPELNLPLNPQGWLRYFGNYEGAIKAFERQLQSAEAGGDVDAQVDAAIALGDMLLLVGRPQPAQRVYEQALALMTAPEDAYWRGVLTSRVGAALQGQNRYGEAALAYRRSLAIHEQLPRRDGEWDVEADSTNIALNLLAAGTFRCADDWAQRLLQRLDNLRAGQVSHIRRPLWSVRGSAALALNRKADARRWHQQALASERTLAGIESNKATSGLVNALNLAGFDESALGNPAAAEALHGEAMALLALLFSTDNPLKADSYMGLAEALRVRRQWPAALEQIRQALIILEALPADRLRLGGAWLQRAEVLRDSGRLNEALAAYREARSQWSEVWPDASHPRVHATLLPGLSRALRSAAAPAAEIAEVDAAARRGLQFHQQQEAQCPK